MRRSSRRKNSTKILFAGASVIAFVFAASYYLFNTQNEVVIARVNGEKIFKSEVERKLRSVFDNEMFAGQSDLKVPELETLPKEVLEVLVKEVYLEKELTKEAKKSDVASSKEVKEKIADVQGKILRQAYVNAVLEQEISEQRINDKYIELTNDLAGKKEYQIAHIVTKTKEDAERISHELKAKKPAKFSDLAKKYSLDQESASKGGELGFVLEDNVVKEIAEVIPSLKKDEVSAPIQTQFGWHLVKILGEREAKPLPFEAVKENIRDQLTQEKINEINSKITGDAKIEILIELKEVKASEDDAAKKNQEEVGQENIETLAPAESAAEAPQDAVESEKPAEEAAASEEKTEEPAKKSEEKTEKKSQDKAAKKSDAKAKQKSSKKQKR